MTDPSNSPGDLKSRVETKRQKIEDDLAGLKAEVSDDNRTQIENLEADLQKLDEALSEGWENLTESAEQKLQEWLKD